MERIKFFFAMTVGLLIFSSGCSTTKVVRVDTEKKLDISGGWNDYDAMAVAEEMVTDALKRRWLDDFLKEKGRDPVVIVGHVENRSHEHISAAVITKHLERELMNSGKVVFVASQQEREDLREERLDQQEGFTDMETAKVLGKERGADFMLIGSIDSVKDELKNEYVIFYQMNLELIDLENNQKVWIGQKKIKKHVKRRKYSL